MSISTSIYLDTRHTPAGESKSTATYPIKIAITKGGSTAYLPTGIKVKIANWKNGKIIGLADRASLNTHLQSIQSNVMNIILECRAKGLYANKTASEIKNDVAKRIGESEAPVNLFMSYYDNFAERRTSDRTKEIYRVTGRKIRALIPKADKIPIEDIDLNWLEDLDELLIAKGNNPSTRSIDFRNIRAVVRDAKTHKLIKENPFEEFNVPTGESPDRALTIEQLRTLVNAEIRPWEQKYLDFFVLSFMLIGINTEDLLHARCLENGRLDYTRAKTGRKMSIKVEPEALEIIERYKGQKYLLNILDTYSSTHNWTAKVDKNLKEISKRNGLPEVTMYWARHTWATLANIDLEIELGTVSSALGHQPPKKVTLIYIKKKDYSRVDVANRKVIDYLLSK